ncbi:hypothetical protein ABIA32_004105 [Streptacidiphilus sp. MAP12-20]|uniref:hypothetical protein n=1 Tax=Streptacidiphilus sp. MAP12-20 TaxID=3156299 RepID=UPI003515EBD0
MNTEHEAAAVRLGTARRQPHTRTNARVLRVQGYTAFVELPAWRTGAILGAVDVDELAQDTDLAPDELVGAHLSVAVLLDALLPDGLRPHGWEAVPPLCGEADARPSRMPRTGFWTVWARPCPHTQVNPFGS